MTRAGFRKIGFVPPWRFRKPAMGRLASFLPLLLACSAAAQSPGGYVLKLQGSWMVDNHPLHVGDVVRANQLLNTANPDDSISLVLYDGTYLNCVRGKTRPTKCTLPINIHTEAKREKLMLSLIKRLTNDFLLQV